MSADSTLHHPFFGDHFGYHFVYFCVQQNRLEGYNKNKLMQQCALGFLNSLTAFEDIVLTVDTQSNTTSHCVVNQAGCAIHCYTMPTDRAIAQHAVNIAAHSLPEESICVRSCSSCTHTTPLLTPESKMIEMQIRCVIQMQLVTQP